MKVAHVVRQALSTTLLSLLALSSSTQAARIQSSHAKAHPSRANAVRSSFQRSFNDYLRYAKGADELLPLSKGRTGGFGGWGATYIDAMTTAHVMGLDDVVKDGIKFATTVDFTHTNQTEISLFETNIRFLGGLLSLYELTGKTEQALVAQAKVIGDHLLTAWQGDNDIPYNILLDWDNFGSPNTTTGAIIAEAGTLLIEFDRLSKYTGDDSE
jgi:mannosyl-oligosaccharide alpha-1,2-mannosidase